MTKLELLEDEATSEHIEIINHPFSSNKIKGLYIDGTVALNKNIDTSTERACILAEELGHYYTSVGNILNQSSSSNRKQERRARLLAYDKLVGLSGIISCHRSGNHTLSDMATHLDVSEQFLAEAISCYRSKYGRCAYIDNYVIFFEPYLGVLELM